MRACSGFHTDTNQNWDTIDFGLHCSNHADNAIYVYESGNERGTFGAYAADDKLRVSIVGGVVKYSRNGTVFYTSTLNPTYPLRVDAALYENGATLINGIVSGNLSSSGGSANIQWLVPDQLGTPRMVVDSTGSLAGIKRHDYLPFGEELFAGQGGRTLQQGYAADGIRQKFTQKERDNETGLDYFLARYYSSTEGRFMSPDLFAGKRGNPQTLNRYSYVKNNPLKYIDPAGYFAQDPKKDCPECANTPETADILRINSAKPSRFKRALHSVGRVIARVVEGIAQDQGREAREDMLTTATTLRVTSDGLNGVSAVIAATPLREIVESDPELMGGTKAITNPELVEGLDEARTNK
jgi:RHS repeat-associated protein